MKKSRHDFLSTALLTHVYTFIVKPRLARATANPAKNTAYVARIAMAVGVSASSVRMNMLTAPVARFAAMNTGNMFKLIAAKICEIGCWKLPDERMGTIWGGSGQRCLETCKSQLLLDRGSRAYKATACMNQQYENQVKKSSQK